MPQTKPVLANGSGETGQTATKTTTTTTSITANNNNYQHHLLQLVASMLLAVVLLVIYMLYISACVCAYSHVAWLPNRYLHAIWQKIVNYNASLINGIDVAKVNVRASVTHSDTVTTHTAQWTPLSYMCNKEHATYTQQKQTANCNVTRGVQTSWDNTRKWWPHSMDMGP